MAPNDPTNPYQPGTPEWYNWQAQHVSSGQQAQTTTSGQQAAANNNTTLDPTLLNRDVNNQDYSDVNRNTNQQGYSEVNRNVEANTQQNVTESQNTQSNIDRNETSTSTRDSAGNEVTTGTTRKYIDVPTDAEFLDDFRNGFSGYVAQAQQSGALSLPAATWAMDHESLFFQRYLGTLTQMAQAGVPLFRTVGVNGPTTYLGSRAGNVTNQNVLNNTVEQTIGQSGVNQNENQNTNRNQQTNQTQDQTQRTNTQNEQNTGQQTNTQNEQNQQSNIGGQGSGQASATFNGQPFDLGTAQLLNQIGVRVPGLVYNPGTQGGFNQGTNTTTNQNQNENQNQNSNQNTNETSNQNTNQSVNNIQNNTIGSQQNGRTNQTVSGSSNVNRSNSETEQLYSRPNVTNVHTLSPTDYLTGTLPASALQVMYEGTKYSDRYSSTGVGQPKSEAGGV